MKSVISIALLLIAIQLQAQNLELAEQAYKDGHYERAAEILKTLADKGKPEALYFLGRMYLEGDGVEKDGVQGLLLLERSANEGFAPAHLDLSRELDQFLSMMILRNSPMKKRRLSICAARRLFGKRKVSAVTRWLNIN